ncbi:hypothetical protein MRB53_000625 [Persea americana]|uniref:Uncharacterized protein n=1 Tax=Persea americana TaxID=3435 RepID=A0ACC2MPE0_PERAE|nr:hypothetical protein MRB53_000625 [Persea americana]
MGSFGPRRQEEEEPKREGRSRSCPRESGDIRVDVSERQTRSREGGRRLTLVLGSFRLLPQWISACRQRVLEDKRLEVPLTQAELVAELFTKVLTIARMKLQQSTVFKLNGTVGATQFARIC